MPTRRESFCCQEFEHFLIEYLSQSTGCAPRGWGTPKGRFSHSNAPIHYQHTCLSSLKQSSSKCLSQTIFSIEYVHMFLYLDFYPQIVYPLFTKCSVLVGSGIAKWLMPFPLFTVQNFALHEGILLGF